MFASPKCHLGTCDSSHRSEGSCCGKWVTLAASLGEHGFRQETGLRGGGERVSQAFSVGLSGPLRSGDFTAWVSVPLYLHVPNQRRTAGGTAVPWARQPPQACHHRGGEKPGRTSQLREE